MSQNQTNADSEHTEITNALTCIFAAIGDYGNIIREIAAGENSNDEYNGAEYSTTLISDPLDRYWE